MRVLGISAFYHDSAAALIEDGRIVAAAQEERFTRKKHDSRFPSQAIAYCLEAGGIAAGDIDKVAFYDKPFLKFERLLETYVSFAPRGFASFRMAMPLWLREKLFQRSLLTKELKKLAPGIDWNKRLLFSEHHLSHAASAFYPSPFEEALVLTMDGVGEWATTSAALGRGKDLAIIREIHFPHSLGLLYSAFTYYTGFRVNSGEYKLMGLAPYGEPKYVSLIRDNLIDLKPDGSFWLDQSYFDYCTGLTMTNGRFDALFGGPARKPEAPVTQKDMDLAASIQAVTEEVMLRLTRSLQAETGRANLCLAGGVALNCVANGKVLRDGRFKNIWIQPAAGDAGGALGAALSGLSPEPRQAANHPGEYDLGDAMQGSYLGPAYEQKDIERRLAARGRQVRGAGRCGADRPQCGSAGRAEGAGLVSGPHGVRPARAGRALDPGRCALAHHPEDAEPPGQIPRILPPLRAGGAARGCCRLVRAGWRFALHAAGGTRCDRIAAAAMDEEQRKLFGIDKLNVARSDIPAVTHVDYSARIQTVHRETNPRFHALISAFKQKTGCPVVVNTSFNVRGEPVVCTPEDAFRCFMGTEIEALAIGNCFLEKQDQDPALKRDYRNVFDAD